MKSSTLLSTICFAVFTVIHVRASQSYNDTLIANLRKARTNAESLDTVSGDANSKNAKTSGLKILEGLKKISDFVDAATDGTCDIPADTCPAHGAPGGSDIISAIDGFSSEYQDLIDKIGQQHKVLTKAGFECDTLSALEHSEASYQALVDALYAELPCRKSDIDDDALDLKGKFSDVIKIYGGCKKSGNGSSSKSRSIDASNLGFRRLR